MERREEEGEREKERIDVGETHGLVASHTWPWSRQGGLNLQLRCVPLTGNQNHERPSGLGGGVRGGGALTIERLARARSWVLSDGQPRVPTALRRADVSLQAGVWSPHIVKSRTSRSIHIQAFGPALGF